MYHQDRLLHRQQLVSEQPLSDTWQMSHSSLTRNSSSTNTALGIQALSCGQCRREWSTLTSLLATIRTTASPADLFQQVFDQIEALLSPRAICLLVRDVVTETTGVRLMQGTWTHLSQVIDIPVTTHYQHLGTLRIATNQPVTTWDTELLTSMANLIAGALYQEHLYAVTQHEQAQRCAALVRSWQYALRLHDVETSDHSQRVLDLALRMARSLGIPQHELVHIQHGVLLHDIGKLGVPIHILHKAEPLTSAEWQIIRQHPLYALHLLGAITDLQPALEIPVYHHEKWDGTGYPYGLCGDQIPLAARMFAIVDVWDALSSDRDYRRAWQPERVYDYIASQSGTHFDPVVVQTFFDLVPSNQVTTHEDALP